MTAPATAKFLAPCEKCGKEVPCDGPPKKDTRYFCRACFEACFEDAADIHITNRGGKLAMEMEFVA